MKSLTAKKEIIILFVVGTSLIIGVLWYIDVRDDFSFFRNEKDNDVSNWATLAVALGVSTIIAISILIYSSEITTNVNAILNQHKEFQQKKKSTGEFYVGEACRVLLLGVKNLLDKIILYEDAKMDLNDLKEQLDKWESRRLLSIEHLDTHMNSYSDVLNAETLLWVFELSDDLKARPASLLFEHPKQIILYGIFISIDAIAKSLDNKKLKNFIDDNQEIKTILQNIRNKTNEFMKNITPDKLKEILEKIQKEFL